MSPAAHEGAALRLPTRDPFTGEALVVTRLVNPATGAAFEGRFALGWLGRLTTDQIDFIGLLLARRNNVQKLAADLGIAYNTARARFEEIMRAVGGDDEEYGAGKPTRKDLRRVLEQLAAGQMSPDDADRALSPADPEG